MKKCANCGRMTRPYNAKASDYPGTVAYHAKGLCNSCYVNPDIDIEAVKAVYPRQCKQCGVSMRPNGTNPDEYPTTEDKHHGRGMCTSCYWARSRTPKDDPYHEYNVRALERFLARIKTRRKHAVTNS